MGNFCSISIPCDRLFSGSLDFISRKASYISKLEENVDRLRNEVEELGDLHRDVTRKVQVEEEQQREQLEQVRMWISRAEDAISKSKELLRDRSQKLKNCVLEVTVPRTTCQAIGLPKKWMRGYGLWLI
ncbi:hypothetical protein OIU77_015456 [Salix suchowensis]|uniref:Disease resistance protein n=1 Tax=Salix suchowensis TaxID=1278906 RepID=A0ABQ8ZH91_9ROSI|nr:hypothetical protein OIU77_015456 [Salix suchowensis]